MPITIETNWKRSDTLKLCASFHASSHDPATGGSRLLSFGDEPHQPPPERLLNRELDRVPFTRSWATPDGGIFTLRGSAPKHSLTSTGSGIKSLAVHGQVTSAALAWRKRRLYVAYRAPDGNKIDRIDLANGKRRTMHESKMLHEVTTSHRGELVHWPILDFGAIELLRDSGKSARLTEFGWYPAFSKKGDMAFLMGDHTLWLRAAGGRLSRLASCWSPLDPAQTDFPSWCPCGRHVAALVGGAFRDKWVARDVVIADVVSRQVMIVEQAVVDPSSNRGETGWSGESTWAI